jgi:hypothetical protein
MTPPWIHSRTLIIGLCAALLGCSDPVAPAGSSCTRNSTVVVTVGDGPSPEISWYPKLLVATVALHGYGDNGPLIWYAPEGGNALPPPVQVYGVLAPSFYQVNVICEYSDGLTTFNKIIGTKSFTR